MICWQIGAEQERQMCENFAEREYKKKFLEAFRRKYGKNAKFSMGYMCIFAVTPLAGVRIEILAFAVFATTIRHPPRGGEN